MQFIFAYNYLDNKDNRPQKTCAWVCFEWIERAFFRSPLNDVFVGIFWNVIIFFLYKNANIKYLVAHPYPQNACMRCMPMFTHCVAKSNTISMRLYYPINRYRKNAKLFRQSVQLIERQVLSNYLRGYKGEFLIWSWGLKNKVFLSMNFMTNFGLTSNRKSCAIFNSECMLVFTACSLLFRENKVKKLIHWGPL